MDDTIVTSKRSLIGVGHAPTAVWLLRAGDDASPAWRDSRCLAQRYCKFHEAEKATRVPSQSLSLSI